MSTFETPAAVGVGKRSLPPVTHRLVVCWPSSDRYSRQVATRRALLATAHWCERRRVYPGPAAVSIIRSWGEMPAAARALAVPEAVLGDALHGLVREMPRALNTFARPVAAVGFHVRVLDASSPAPGQSWSAAA